MERAAWWLWKRGKQHLVGYTIAVSVLLCLVVIAWPGVVVAAVFFHLSLRDAAVFGATASLVVTVAVTAGMPTLGRSVHRTARAWIDGDHSDPLAMSNVALDAPRWLSVRVALLQVLLHMPTTLVVGARLFHLSWVGTLALAGSIIMLIGAGFAVLAIGFELILRPLKVEVAEALDGGVPPHAARWGLAARLLVIAAGTTWAAGMATALITTRFHTPEAQFTAAFVAALATTTVFCLGYVRTFGLRPVLRPIEDLIDGTKRVAAGDLSARLLVTSDDELGELVASFNHMVRGLAERERLRAAFGSYLDPALVARLLSQGEDVFAGEEVEVTVFFADIRNFTAFAEGASPREVVARLNALFEMIVPVLRKHHGHANKFMGDGVLAVFGAPEATAHHADDALAAAIEVQRRVHEQFGEMLRIGIGINTGPVIAGTIGGGGKLEFTLIGDPVNVAARVEELTKGNADAILLTQATVDALACPPATLVGRGTHLLRGKSTPVDVYALQPMSDAAVSA